MSKTPPIAEGLWNSIPEEARLAISDVIAQKDKWIATLISARNGEEPYSFRMRRTKPKDPVRCISQRVYDTAGKLVDEIVVNVEDESGIRADEADNDSDDSDEPYIASI